MKANIGLKGNYNPSSNLVEIPLATGCDSPSTGAPKRDGQHEEIINNYEITSKPDGSNHVLVKLILMALLNLTYRLSHEQAKRGGA